MPSIPHPVVHHPERWHLPGANRRQAVPPWRGCGRPSRRAGHRGRPVRAGNVVRDQGITLGLRRATVVGRTAVRHAAVAVFCRCTNCRYACRDRFCRQASHFLRPHAGRAPTSIENLGMPPGWLATNRRANSTCEVSSHRRLPGSDNNTTMAGTICQSPCSIPASVLTTRI